VLPVVGVFAGCGVMLLYPLRNGVHEQIVEQLDERKRAARAQLASEAS
jgi:Na+/melibiose symporter-like transporter